MLVQVDLFSVWKRDSDVGLASAICGATRSHEVFQGMGDDPLGPPYNHQLKSLDHMYTLYGVESGAMIDLMASGD